jgi:nicotinate-nucleotide adenylyltransferase
LERLCAADKQPRLIQMPAVEVSSSEIRRRIAAGEPIQALVPRAVEDYIRLHGLYR